MGVIKIKNKLLLIIFLFCLTGCTSIETNVRIKNMQQSTTDIEITVPKLAFETLEYSCNEFITDLKKFDIFKNCLIENKTNLMYESILIHTDENNITHYINQYLIFDNNQYQLNIPKEDIAFVDISEIKNNAFFNYHDLKKYNINIYLNIIMPGNITKSTIGDVHLNKTSIDIIDYVFNNKAIEDITITSKTSLKDNRYIYMLPIIICLLIFFIKKRKYYS